MDDFGFLEPARLLALAIPAGLAIGYLALQARRRRYALRFTTLDLLDEVAPDRPGWRRHLTALGVLLAIVIASLGFARPVVAGEIKEAQQIVVLAIDVSLSMQAEDVAPTRMEAAREAAGVFLDRRRRLGRTLIAVDLVRAAAFLMLAIAAQNEWVTTTMVFAIAFLVGSMAVLFDSGLQSWMTVSLLENDLVRANAAKVFIVLFTTVPVLLIFASFIGGSAGSTAGGIKVIRWLLVYKQGVREIVRLVHPSAEIPVKLGNKAVPYRVVDAVWGFFSIYVIVFAAMMLAMMATGLDQVTAFSAVAATLNNLGPGLGDVAKGFMTVSDVGKWIAIAGMLLGRLEIFTLLVLITPTFWRR